MWDQSWASGCRVHEPELLVLDLVVAGQDPVLMDRDPSDRKDALVVGRVFHPDATDRFLDLDSQCLPLLSDRALSSALSCFLAL